MYRQHNNMLNLYRTIKHSIPSEWNKRIINFTLEKETDNNVNCLDIIIILKTIIDLISIFIKTGLCRHNHPKILPA